MQSSNYKKIKKVLIVIMLLNFLVSGLKIIIGYTTNSNAIATDGLHSLTDGLNNIVGVVALSFAYKPADKEHPYGHKKIENIISLFIGFVLLLMSYNIIKENIVNFDRVEAINLSTISILVMITTLIINLFVTSYERKMGNELNSSFLISDAAHTMSDVYVSISVIISIIGIKYFNLPPYFDKIMAMVVAIFILKAGIEIISEATKVLVDQKVINEEQVKKIVYSFKEVKDTHMIKSRGIEDDMHLDLHIEVDPNMSVSRAHALSHDIENSIQKTINPNTNVIIHVEPHDESAIDN
ncbi:cation diffusion facilitator family transporter [Mycoplasma sp. P36-A1]|uniref:cation diffusion facilitator family transporter n=1 Tax=Mycoplasma sp. P36-A1 TaxID=3252900 RepID=UPI003C2F4740